MRREIPDKWFILPILILAAYFLLRLINQSQMIWIFPTDAFANDFSGHIVKLFLLDKYGYLSNVPEWYNGTYTMLKFYPPVWYLFSLPFLWVFQKAELAVFASMVFMYLLGFIFLSFLGKYKCFSMAKRIAFFLFFFANPISIGYFMRLGKMPEMLAWVFFILFFTLLMIYLNKKLDWKFKILFILLYTLIFYIHTLVFIAASLLILGFWLSRDSWKEKFSIIFQSLIVLILTSFFWYPLIAVLKNTNIASWAPLKWLILPGNLSDKIASFIIPPIFWIISYFYLKGKNKKERIFFSIPIIFSVLIFTRIGVFIPFFNRASPDTYHLLMILISSFMFLSLRLDDIPKRFRKPFPYILTVLIIISVIISVGMTPFFKEHTQIVEETFQLFELAEGPLLVVKGDTEIHPASVLSYATLYYGISTPIGWEPINVTEEFWDKTLLPERLIMQKKVKDLSFALKSANVKSIIAYDNDCETLKESDLMEVKTLKRACLYTLK